MWGGKRTFAALRRLHFETANADIGHENNAIFLGFSPHGHVGRHLRTYLQKKLAHDKRQTMEIAFE